MSQIATDPGRPEVFSCRRASSEDEARFNPIAIRRQFDSWGSVHIVVNDHIDIAETQIAARRLRAFAARVIKHGKAAGLAPYLTGRPYLCAEERYRIAITLTISGPPGFMRWLEDNWEAFIK